MAIKRPNHEFASQIIHAVETGVFAMVTINVTKSSFGQ